MSTALVAALAGGSATAATPPLPERVSVADSDAHPGQGDSWSLASGRRIGAGGRVAYTTQATNLAGGETRGRLNVVLRDLDSGEAWRASLAPDGAPFDRSAEDGIVSRDGEAVVFDVTKTELNPPFLTTWASVYVFDRPSGTVREFSLPTTSPSSSGYSVGNDIVRVAGQILVAFTTYDAIDGDDDTWSDVYATSGNGLYERISARPDGRAGNGYSNSAQFTSDGRYVFFVSSATDLLASPLAVAQARIFVRDRQTRTTALVTPVDASAYSPAISGDPRYVAFLSGTASLVAGDTNGATDAFLLDRSTNVVSRISIAPGGVQPDLDVTQVALCTGGMKAVFVTRSTVLPGAAGAGVDQYYVKDLMTGTLSAGQPVQLTTWPNTTASPVIVSDDCAQIAYSTGTGDPTPGDRNEAWDAVAGPLVGTTRQVFSRREGAPLPAQANGPSLSARQSISADGNRIVFASRASNLVVGDDNRRQDIFVRDRAASTTTRVNRHPDGEAFVADATCPSISADGEVVAYLAQGGDVGMGPDGWYLVVADVATAMPDVIAAVPSPPAEPSFDDCPSLSTDGSRVAFSSDAALVPQDANGVRDAYVYDRDASTFLLASINAAGTFAGDGASTSADLSGDGRHLVFETAATDIAVAWPRPGIFARDLASGTTSLVHGDTEYAGNGAAPRIDHGGATVGLLLDALVQPFQCNGSDRALFRFAGPVAPTCISRSLVNVAGAGRTSSWAYSAHGRWAASWSGSNACVASDCRSVYLLDARSGEPVATSRSESGGTITVGPVFGRWLQPAVADQGAVVYATSSAMRIDDVLGQADVYVLDGVAPDTLMIASFE